MTPPLPSPPRTAPTARILAHTFASPTNDRWNWHSVVFCNVRSDSAGGPVDNEWPLACCQNVVGRQGEREFLTNETTCVVNDCQTIRIRVLCEPRVGSVSDNSLTQITQVLFNRFRDMFKTSVGGSAKKRRLRSQAVPVTEDRMSHRCHGCSRGPL